MWKLLDSVALFSTEDFKLFTLLEWHDACAWACQKQIKIMFRTKNRATLYVFARYLKHQSTGTMGEPMLQTANHLILSTSGLKV